MNKEPAPKRKLAAIMFSDIAGFTTMMGSDENKGLQLLRKNREIHKLAIARNNGKWLKEMGDGVLVKFKSAYDSVICAIEIQERALLELDLKIRIGIHLGDITIDNQDVFGDGVNIASRLQSIAEPGGIFISESVYKSIKSNVDLKTEYIGEIGLKNVAQPIKTYFLASEFLIRPSNKRRKDLLSGIADPDRKKNRSIILITSIILALGIIFISFFYLGKQNENTIKEVQSIAVLPFDNLSGDPGQEYFSDAMTEAIITNLAKIGALTVISRTSAMLYKNSKKSLPEIAEELNVDVVLEGSVTRANQMVRITAQLIESKTDRHLWAETYDRDMTHILLLQSEVAQAIASEIKITITPEEKDRISEVNEVNPAAYEAYVRGRYYMFKLTPANYVIAMNYFERALVLDPNYSKPYVGIAGIWLHRALWGGYHPDEAIPKAEKALELARDRGEKDGDADMVLASIQYSYKSDYEASERGFLRAISIIPNRVEPHLFFGDFLLSMKRYDEAIQQIELGLKLDPMNSFSYCMLGWGQLVVGDIANAETNLLKSVEMSNDLSLSLRCLWTLYQMQEKKDLAFVYAERFYNSQGLEIVAETIQKNKNNMSYKETLIKAAAKLEEKSKETFVPSMRIARLYALANQDEIALDYLEKSLKERFASNFALNIDPHWNSLREIPLQGIDYETETTIIIDPIR